MKSLRTQLLESSDKRPVHVGKALDTQRRSFRRQPREGGGGVCFQVFLSLTEERGVTMGL